jgi:dipeptidyl aminopeptidase/acylaminoacyl peptidase
MLKPLVLLCALVTAAPLAAQGAQTSVFVAPVTRIGDSIVLGRAVSVGRRDGVADEPAFTADSRALLFVANVGGRSDIWRYELAGRRARQLTKDAASASSPRAIPQGSRFSAVRTATNGSRRLWSYAADGSDPRPVLERLGAVGAYTWLSPSTLAISEQGTPSTLHLAESDGSYDVVISSDVGRVVESVPVESKALFSFTQRGFQDRPGIFVFTGRADTTRFVHEVVRINPERRGVLAETKRTTVVDSVVIASQRPYQLVGLAGDNPFHVWTPDGTLLTASGTALLRWSNLLGAGSTWIHVADVGATGVARVTRLAFSPDGRWLAFAGER